MGLDAPEEEKKGEVEPKAEGGADGEEETKGGEGEDGEPAKKKKKKKKKNKGGAGGVQYAPREQDNSELRLLGNWAPGEWKQTIDYTIPVS